MLKYALEQTYQLISEFECYNYNMPDNSENEVISVASGENGTIHYSTSFPSDTDLKFQFSNVSYASKQNNKKKLQILDDTCGEFKSGRLTAILGPSGAGKTSLLNVLSGFKYQRVSGHFLVNGKERNLLAFRKISCYIPQDFALLDLLTVQETLRDSTDLKLPTETCREIKKKIIDEVLSVLNMDKCRHTLVRNLSGGERKRLSIAIELVTNPPLMFFDEPTSGLDSVSSLQIINYLRRLAHGGRIIVCVIHQPSSRLMKLFDDVVVLSHGNVLYAGTQHEMLSTFEKAGFMCPSFYNPADFVLEVGSMEQDANIMALIENNRKKYSLVKNRCNSQVTADERTEMLQKPNGNSATCIELSAIEPEKNCCTLIRPKEQVGVGQQFFVLTRRQFLSMSRNLLAVQLRLVMHVVVGTLLGVVFWDIGNDGAKVLTNSSCIFFLVLFVFFGNAMPSILLCPQDTAVFIREYLNGWYSTSAYYVAKTVADLPMQFTCPTVFIIIVYFMTGQLLDVGRFAMCWGITLLCAIIGHFIGLVFGSTFEMQMAIFLVPGVTIPFLVFSGFFIRLHELSSFLRPLCDVSFFRYTMEGFMQAIYGYARPDLDCNVDFCYFKSPEKFLKELGMLGDLYGRNVFMLLLWILALMVLFYFSLLMRIRKAQ